MIFHNPIEKKVTRIGKNEEEIIKNIFRRLQLLDSAIFRTSSLSDLVRNLAKGIHKIKCIYGRDNNKCETCGTK